MRRAEHHEGIANVLREAASDIASRQGPAAVKAHGICKMEPPLSDFDAKRTREKMAARYHAWTGRSLADDLADDAINVMEGDHDR